jgi:hypothetical protein
VLALVVVSTASACADDTPATTIDFGDGTAGTEAMTSSTTVGADTTATDPGSGSAGSSAGDTETAGDPPLSGQSMSQLVSAGDRSASANYVLVFTVGQPSQLQGTHQSASYVLQGGLVGANGSPP